MSFAVRCSTSQHIDFDSGPRGAPIYRERSRAQDNGPITMPLTAAARKNWPRPGSGYSFRNRDTRGIGLRTVSQDVEAEDELKSGSILKEVALRVEPASWDPPAM